MKWGEIVILNVPFPDGTGSRRRIVGAKTQLFIDITSPDGKSSGLRADSVVQCNHLVTTDQSLIHRTIARLSAALMQQINDCLKASFEIP